MKNIKWQVGLVLAAMLLLSFEVFGQEQQIREGTGTATGTGTSQSISPAQIVPDGTQIPDGAVATGLSGVAGPMLTKSGATRSWSYNGAALTNTGVVTPLQFGAVGDGVTDDTLAVSNAFNAINKGPTRVFDGLGRTYLLKQPMPQLTNVNMTLQNADFAFSNSAAGNYIWVKDLPGNGNNFIIQHCGLRQLAPALSPECNGLRLGDFSASLNGYGIDATVYQCIMTNWWRAIYIDGMSQTRILQNTITCNYSNSIYVSKLSQPDMIDVWCNAMDYDMFTRPTDLRYRQARVIQVDGYVHAFRSNGNNMGGASQVVYFSPTALCDSGELAYDSCGTDWNSDPNECPIEIWNSQFYVHDWRFADYDGVSNRIAIFGMYATNSLGTTFQGRLNLSQWKFERITSPGMVLDIWSTNEVDGAGFPYFDGGIYTVRYHPVTQRDTPTIYGNTLQYGPKWAGNVYTINTPENDFKLGAGNQWWITMHGSGNYADISGQANVNANWVFHNPTDFPGQIVDDGGHDIVLNAIYTHNIHLQNNGSTTFEQSGNQMNCYAPLRMVPRSAPSSPTEGTLYYNSSTHHLNYWNGTSWVAL